MEKKSARASQTNIDAEALTKAEAVTLADFSTAMSSGILRALDARKPGDRKWLPWVWAGWIIGDGPIVFDRDQSDDQIR